MARRAWRHNGWRWKVLPPFAQAAELARSSGACPLVAQMLHNRGVSEVAAAKSFLNPRLSELHDPMTLGGCQAAAERLAKAVADKEKIVLYGDYDVDGMTGVAILHAMLKMAGACVEFYVPHRLEEGYGLNLQAVTKCRQEGAQLLVTVDCGITAAQELAAAASLGLDVIVTDHHAFDGPPPPATAVVHPALAGSQYGNPHLCGAGVAFKLAWQLARQLCGEHRVDQQMRDFLVNATCLAALGTIADVVPLCGENRVLATHGLRGLPASSHVGLRALLEEAELTGQSVDAYHVGFVLAPRLNACGRMGHAAMAVELLTGADPQRCRHIAQYLSQQNTQRQQVERQMVQQAIELVESRAAATAGEPVIVLAQKDWHGGVIGIVASRLVEQFGRPAVLIALNGEIAHGSARSVSGFNMRDALAACQEHVVSFGGHAMAGGLRIRPEKIEDFASAMQRHAAAQKLQSVQEELLIDAETSLAALSYPVAQQLEGLAPFGQGNPAPVVAVRSCRVLGPPRRMGRNGQTVAITLQQDAARMRAVGFGMGDLADKLAGINKVDAAGQVAINRFNGSVSVELKLLDVVWD